jgi:Protein of unknown function (DUF3131)
MKHLHFLLLVVVVGVASAAEVANMASSDLSTVSLEGTWKVSAGDLAPANAYIPDLDDSNWTSLQVPGNWHLQGKDYSGADWHRTSEAEVALTAWRYFEGNYQPVTGWFDSVHGYPFTTMWDLSSSIAAVACAEKLGVISPERGHELLGSLLRTLSKIPLYNDEPPNREYGTNRAEISGPRVSDGKATGWSAIDLGRLLIWLRIVSVWHPEYEGLARNIVQHWKFGRLAQGGEMFGVYASDPREYRRQEGRLGYEQYSAAGFELWGVTYE